MDRQPLGSGTRIKIDSHEYEIAELIGFGGSCLAYNAYELDSSGNRINILYCITECYPYVDFVIRKQSGQITVIDGKSKQQIDLLKMYNQIFLDAYDLVNKVHHGNVKIRYRTNKAKIKKTENSRWTSVNNSYLVMESLTENAVSIKNLVCRDKKTYSLEKYLAIISELLFRLGAIHSQRILHLDLSANNVFVENDREESSEYIDVKILDYSSARKSDNNGICIVEGLLPKTKGYDAPEMSGEKERTISRSTDIYSVGCILLYLISHELAYFVKKITSRDFANLEIDDNELLMNQLTKIVQKMLSKDMEKRYNDTSSAGIDVRKLLNYIRSLSAESGIYKKSEDRLLPQEDYLSRNEILEQIDENDRVIGVLGPPGCGKSTFAYQYLSDHKERYSNYLIISAETKESFSKSVNFFINERMNYVDQMVEKLENAAEGEKTLILFDNVGFDQIENCGDNFYYDVMKIIDELAKSPNMSIIFTSRTKVLRKDNYKLITLDNSFSYEQGTKYLKSNVNFDVTDDDIKYVFDTYGFIPLVLKSIKSQAKIYGSYRSIPSIDLPVDHERNLDDIIDDLLMNMDSVHAKVLSLCSIMPPEESIANYKLFGQNLIDTDILFTLEYLAKKYEIIEIDNATIKIHRSYQKAIMKSKYFRQNDVVNSLLNGFNKAISWQNLFDYDQMKKCASSGSVLHKFFLLMEAGSLVDRRDEYEKILFYLQWYYSFFIDAENEYSKVYQIYLLENASFWSRNMVMATKLIVLKDKKREEAQEYLPQLNRTVEKLSKGNIQIEELSILYVFANYALGIYFSDSDPVKSNVYFDIVLNVASAQRNIMDEASFSKNPTNEEIKTYHFYHQIQCMAVLMKSKIERTIHSNHIGALHLIDDVFEEIDNVGLQFEYKTAYSLDYIRAFSNNWKAINLVERKGYDINDIKLAKYLLIQSYKIYSLNNLFMNMILELKNMQLMYKKEAYLIDLYSQKAEKYNDFVDCLNLSRFFLEMAKDLLMKKSTIDSLFMQEYNTYMYELISLYSHVNDLESIRALDFNKLEMCEELSEVGNRINDDVQLDWGNTAKKVLNSYSQSVLRKEYESLNDFKAEVVRESEIYLLDSLNIFTGKHFESFDEINRESIIEIFNLTTNKYKIIQNIRYYARSKRLLYCFGKDQKENARMHKLYGELSLELAMIAENENGIRLAKEELARI